MYPIEQVKEFSKLLNVYNVLTNENVRTEFLQMYAYTFEEYPSCSGCPDEIENAIFKFMWIIKKHTNQSYLMKANSISKYTMKDKVRIYSSSLGIVVTKYNCTDAIAEALIKENPNCINSFIVNVQVEPKPIETFSVVNPDPEPMPIAKVKTEKEKKIVPVEKGKRGRKKKVA